MRETPQIEGRETTRSKSSVVRRKPQIEAAKTIVELAGPRQGYRHMVLGSTGRGKTWWLKLLARYASMTSDYVLIHDAKDREAQYKGEVYARIGDVVSKPPRSNTLIFRGTHPESVARYGWKLADTQKTSLVLIDEIYDALANPMHFSHGKDSYISAIARKGRSRGVSFATTTQIPQSLPTVLIDLSDTKAIFGMDSRSLSYIEGSMRLESRVVEVVRTLKVGEFVLIVQGQDWDGVIYGPN